MRARSISLLLLCLTAALGRSAANAAEGLDLVAVSVETDRLAEASFQEMVARERRMIAVAARVRRASTELCTGFLAPILGLQVMTVQALPAAFVSSAVRHFRVTDKVTVVWVLPESAAARAGIAPGDTIVSVDGEDVDDEQELNNRRAAAGATSLRFALRRDEQELAIDVPYEPGCYVQPMLALSTNWNAYAEWRRIVVFSELIREVKNDDELAAVIGHELGHIVLGHERSQPTAEEDADYFGLYLAARAGYDPRAGAEVWRRFARTKPWALIESESHPSAPHRAFAAARAIDEIAAKRATGQPLRPEGLR